MPPAALQHPREHLTCQALGRGEVERDTARNVGLVHLVDEAVRLHCGVVDEHIHRTAVRLDPLDEAVHLRLVRQVDGVGSAAQSGRQRVDCLAVAGHEHHLRPRRREGFRERLAEPAARTCDQYPLARKFHQYVPLFIGWLQSHVLPSAVMTCL
ncbi:unannotated protein [freshwater metagenome]|uniref:Unannotated protein n=1 Tax=freshwater metagenome TaxID=449393 RepID=A0A6J7DLY1_9ZZZZ